MVPNEAHHDSREAITMTAGLNLLVALWFFVSPWVYGAYHMHNAWNSWIVGGVLAIAALIELNGNIRTVANVSWLSIVLSAWVFFSPWIYAYSAESGRFINSLCVGAVAFVLSIIISIMAGRSTSSTVAHRM
jgi:SPW repeat